MGEPGGERLMRKGASWQRASLLELFFDLVFVFALNQVSVRLIQDLSTGRQLRSSEVVETFLLFLALWVLWLSTVALTSRQHPDSLLVQIMVFMAMASAVVMAVAVPQGRALVFAGTYAAARLSRTLLLLLFRRQWIFPIPAQLSLAVSAVLWIVGGLVHDQGRRAALWALALAIGYIGFTAGFPRIAAPIAGEHMAERLQQFYLIALGEAIFVSGKAFSATDLGIPHTVGFGLAFVAIVLLWRVYFYRAGVTLPLAITGARNPTRQSVAVAGTHLLMIAGVFLTGVSFELYIMGPLGRPEPNWLIAILGGPALFLAGRSIFELQVFSRISRTRPAGLLALGLLIPATWYLPPLAAGGAAATVLAGVAGSDAWRSRGHTPAAPTPRI
ncbi:low temperature requirement protein A [Micromonospora sp. NPDC023888]|uniref:low temperature requirement protein A n=1 Tax=Micromonospora sp. NPDC023888 TaxID=3155607 RepID=UPI0033E6DD32